MSNHPFTQPGPFRAPEIREGDPYELSDGHRVECLPAGSRHGGAHVGGTFVLGSDPAVFGQVGIDTGISFNDDKNLRAPDLVVGALESSSGWQRTFPPLAVEYADSGQNESELKKKIAELLAGGTQLVWVVRLAGPLRVEVHAAGKPIRIANIDDELSAPGILRNPVQVRALVDTQVAGAATLRNLLQVFGHGSVEDIAAEGKIEGKIEGKAEGKIEGKAEGKIEALLTVLSTRGLIPSDAQIAEIRACRDEARIGRWLARAAVADAVAAVFA